MSCIIKNNNKNVLKSDTKSLFEMKNWSVYLHFQLPAYGGLISYTVSYKTDEEQTAIRVTSEPDLIIEVSFIKQTQINTAHVPAQNLQ